MQYLYKYLQTGNRLKMAVVHPSTHSLVWSVDYPSFVQDNATGELIEEGTMIGLGIMNCAEDTEGLQRYLKAEGILQQEDEIINYSKLDARGLADVILQKGGKTDGFKKLTNKISKGLVGKKVPKKFQRAYGKRYDKKDAAIAAKNIAGSIVNEKKEKEEDIEADNKKPDPIVDTAPVGNKKFVLQSTVNPDRYFKGVTTESIPVIEYESLKEARRFDTFAQAQEVKEKYYALNQQTKIIEIEDVQEAPVSTPIQEIKTRREDFIDKYGVTPEVLYEGVLAAQKETGMKSNYANMLISMAATPTKLPDANHDAINQDNSATLADMLLCLVETPLLPELKLEIDAWHASNPEHNILVIPSLSKPAIPAPTTSFESFASVVATDDLRPAMMGVYYDKKNQQLAATNAHILAVVKEKITGESKIINIGKPFSVNDRDGKVVGIKTGDEIDARFPDYTVVIPEDNVLIIRNVFAKGVYEQLNGVLKANRLFKGSKNASQIFVTIDTPFGLLIFDPVLFHDLLKFFFKNGSGLLDLEISPKADEGGIILSGVLIRDSKKPKDVWGLLMPLTGGGDRYYVELDNIGKVEIAKDYEKRLNKNMFGNSYNVKSYERAVQGGDQWEIEYHSKKLAESHAATEIMVEKFNALLRAQGLKEIVLKQPYKLPEPKEFAKGGMVSEADVNVVKGKAEIKEGRKIIAKIYDRAVFFKEHKITSGFSHPYSIEIPGVGSRECDTLQECIDKINEYKPGGSAGYADGGEVDKYDMTASMLSEFEFKKQSSATHGGQKWVNRIPKVVTDEELSFIPKDGWDSGKRISGFLIYGLDKFSNDEKKKILAGLKHGKLKVIETPQGNYSIIHKEP